MRHLFLLCSFFLFLSSSKAQKGSILYFLPDSVEIKVNEYISNYKGATRFYFMIENSGKDTFNISVCKIDEPNKSRLDKWVFITNRRVVVNKKNYPLLLDYDYQFSTLNPSNIGVYGKRSNKLVRNIPIFHCYNVKFTKYYILNNENERIGHTTIQGLE